MPVPAKIADRFVAGIKRFQPVVASAKSRDINESDTVTIIKDMLCEVFGYDKYAEITSEYQIRGTYCDLALKLGGELRLLIEGKAIGLELKESYVKQAVDYAANQGVEWVVLTNAELWRVYKVIFVKPIAQELVLEFSFSALNPRNGNDLDMLYLLSKESWSKSLLGDYHTQRQALSRFFIGAMILSEPVLDVLRRELRRISPGVRIEVDEIMTVLAQDVMKRDVLEGEKADEAKKKIQAIYRKIAKDREKAAKVAASGSAPSNGESATVAEGQLEPNVPTPVYASAPRVA